MLTCLVPKSRFFSKMAVRCLFVFTPSIGIMNVLGEIVEYITASGKYHDLIDNSYNVIGTVISAALLWLRGVASSLLAVLVWGIITTVLIPELNVIQKPILFLFKCVFVFNFPV